VAIDQNVTPSPNAAVAVPAVDNEIPAYRAISPAAVISLVLGVLALLSFAHWFFLSCAVLAVAFGIHADRKIQRYSDTLTGRRLAQAGTALGLVFGLTAVTVGLVQSSVQKREAARFARQLADVLKNGSYEEVLMYKWAPAQRASKTKEQILEQIREAEQSAKEEEGMEDEAGMGPMGNGPLKLLRARLAIPTETLHFEKIEGSTVDGLTASVGALFKVEGPGNSQFPEKEQYALLIVKSKTDALHDWWLDQVHFPYKPSTYVPPAPADDGHGHSHAH